MFARRYGELHYRVTYISAFKNRKQPRSVVHCYVVVHVLLLASICACWGDQAVIVTQASRNTSLLWRHEQAILQNSQLQKTSEINLHTRTRWVKLSPTSSRKFIGLIQGSLRTESLSYNAVSQRSKQALEKYTMLVIFLPLKFVPRPPLAWSHCVMRGRGLWTISTLMLHFLGKSEHTQK